MGYLCISLVGRIILLRQRSIAGLLYTCFSFTNGGILSGYMSLLSLIPWWNPQSKDWYQPPIAVYSSTTVCIQQIRRQLCFGLVPKQLVGFATGLKLKIVSGRIGQAQQQITTRKCFHPTNVLCEYQGCGVYPVQGYQNQIPTGDQYSTFGQIQ